MTRMPAGRGKAGAFTMVELLVSVAILSMLFVVMISILDQSSRAWNEAEQRVDAFREGRAAQFIIDRDLKNLTQPTDQPFFFLDQNTTPESVRINADLPPVEHGNTLFFTTLLSKNAQSGDAESNLCLVGYYLAYVPESAHPGARRSYNLYRHVTESNETADALNSFFQTGALPIIATFPRPPAGLNGDEVLARNVINFSVKPYRRDPATGELLLLETPWDNKERPAMVTVEFDALNYATVSLFEQASDWYSSTTLEKVRERVRQHFSSNIKLD